MNKIGRRDFCVLVAASVTLGLGGIAFGQTETTLERIRRTGKATVASEAAYAPYEFVRDGKIVGLGADLLAIVGQELGVEVEQLDLPFQGILPGLLAGRFDFVATSIGLNPERAARYAFTMPIGNATSHLFRRAGNEQITSVEDLNGKVVAAQLGSTDEPLVRELDAKLKAAGGSGFADISLLPGFPEMVMSVANGSADVGAAGLVLISNMLTERPGLLEIVAPTSNEEGGYISWVTRPEDTDLRDELNRIFAGLIASGKMAELQTKWLGTTVDLPLEGYLPEGAI